MKQKKQTIFLSGLIVALTLFTHISVQAVEPGSIDTVDLIKEKNLFVIRISGAIYNIDDLFAQTMAEVPDNSRLLLHLDSPGGQNWTTYKIIDELNKARSRLARIDTTVDNGEKCASACLALYMQGESRFAGEVSAFMFHGARKWYTNIPNADDTENFLSLLIKAGISTDWLNQLRDQGAFTKPGAYWVTGQQLLAQESRVVTDLISHHKLEKPISPPFDPQITSR